LIVYLPPELFAQSAAALANEPDGSGNTYQFRVTGPLLDDPQLASRTDARSAPATLASR
jgi:hypothetical protein